jgi:hypothetical protein
MPTLLSFGLLAIRTTVPASPGTETSKTGAPVAEKRLTFKFRAVVLLLYVPTAQVTEPDESMVTSPPVSTSALNDVLYQSRCGADCPVVSAILAVRINTDARMIGVETHRTFAVFIRREFEEIKNISKLQE